MNPPRRVARFIGSDRYRGHRYSANHPLAIPRVSLTTDLIHAYDAMSADEYLPSPQASVEQLQQFHTADYVAALQRCESEGQVPAEFRQRYRLGTLENPFFSNMFSTPATATGGSIAAAEQVIAGRMAFSPAGGMHHARADQARGFCFFNDPVLAILRLRRQGWRVIYLDIDAHHGDGVELAFADDPQVLTVSLHMDTDYAYPFAGGRIEDSGPLGNALNLPLPRDVHDAEYDAVFSALWPKVLQHFAADAVVLQAGTDILRPDPLGKFRISTQQFLRVVEQIITHSPRGENNVPRLAVLGGGGYHPLALARCWTGVWGLLSGRDLPLALPVQAQQLLRAVDWDQDEDEDYFPQLFQSRIDPPQTGPIRDEVRDRLAQLLREHPLFQTVEAVS
ncbi:MAG: acetoin utilization protein AcuC [Gammaproteobacteria bacterium]|nr:acetoin utilization protein AcuC [Gammaproteobacteria bacterium]